jgi:hypothetical protein
MLAQQFLIIHYFLPFLNNIVHPQLPALQAAHITIFILSLLFGVCKGPDIICRVREKDTVKKLLHPEYKLVLIVKDNGILTVQMVKTAFENMP